MLDKGIFYLYNDLACIRMHFIFMHKIFKDKFSKELIDNLAKDTPEKFNLIKGVIEFGNIVGSVLGLAILAPEVSHIIVHPTMKALGIDKK